MARFVPKTGVNGIGFRLTTLVQTRLIASLQLLTQHFQAREQGEQRKY
ncbi:hypothetical protein FDUTEX481_08264 [Tolypothrix sp. PCC 7601]|nr:hypothetical protein FDUTEX481_08264 [Tolypothrix sp. PCC 7601]